MVGKKSMNSNHLILAFLKVKSWHLLSGAQSKCMLDLCFKFKYQLYWTFVNSTIHLTGNYVFDIEDESDGENDDGDKAELIDFLKKKGKFDG